MPNIRKHTGCMVDGCNKEHKGLGYCQQHYLTQRNRKLKLGDAAKKYSYIAEYSTLCAANMCVKRAYCGGFCNKHYRRFKKGQSFDIPDQTKNKYLIGNLNFIHADRNSWSKAIKQFFGDKCMVCGWDKANCDVHHIVPKAKGGLNSLYNAAVLCPSDHKLADIGKITQDQLLELNKSSISKLKVL